MCKPPQLMLAPTCKRDVHIRRPWMPVLACSGWTQQNLTSWISARPAGQQKEEEILMMSKVALEQIVGKNSIDADHNICHTINNQSFMIPNFANSMCALACLWLNTVKYHKLNCCAASRDNTEEMQVPKIALNNVFVTTDHHVCIEIVLDHVSIWRVCGLGHG